MLIYFFIHGLNDGLVRHLSNSPHQLFTQELKVSYTLLYCISTILALGSQDDVVLNHRFEMAKLYMKSMNVVLVF